MAQPSKRLQAIMDKEERTESKAERRREVRKPSLEKSEMKAMKNKLKKSPTLKVAETKPGAQKSPGRGIKGTDKLSSLQAKNRKKTIPQFSKSSKIKK